MKSHSSEISKITKEKESMMKQISQAELQMQQLEHDIKNCGDKAVDAQQKLKHLLEKHKWIEGQKKYFGVPNSEFDFQNFDLRGLSERLKKLEQTKEKLHKCVNMRAQNMLSSVEEQFENLMKKKEVVLQDKKVIEDFIRELDERKRVSLRDACEQVNKVRSLIFLF
ncbi:structural maintenance of chromosomes protein 2-like [Stegodyphus dumicola]|uniref:structural maintenance of chromosomes protein 2-like n=1 Tax=Stegodyphus dumicola TaxID=202533 RepID=UPI0015A88FE7|nr:structural maintenance of chromosomes protein 2-like [Stegodyphus dumicola]